ncbi:MAG: hypothetical protein IH983_09335 [Planctomycetes bacterium]|nr:hypothetical protein [Planctomycetota bacterium]
MNRIWLSVVLPISFFVVPVQPAEATFDLMQIEQVIGGVNCDTTAQAIQLRMRANFQNLVSQARLRVWDAQGLNPVVVINFGQNVAFAGCGRRVLITSLNFNSLTTPNTIPNFTMTNLIPASYLAAGSLTFENNFGSVIYWRLSWGGNGYTGPTTGSITNDADGNFGPPWRGPLPSQGLQALQFQPSCFAPSTTNAADYALTSSAAVFTNNSGQSFALIKPSVADFSGPLGPGCPDGCVDAFDLGTLLGAWCSSAGDPDPPKDVDPPCEGCVSPNFALADISGAANLPDGCVDAFDLAKLLANWCSVTGGNPCGTCGP